MVKLVQVQAKHLVAALFDSKNYPWRCITMRITQVLWEVFSNPFGETLTYMYMETTEY